MVVGALNRDESRGGHFREDFPDRDDKNYMRHTMAYRRPLPVKGHRLWGTEGDGDHKGSFAHTTLFEDYHSCWAPRPSR